MVVSSIQKKTVVLALVEEIELIMRVDDLKGMVGKPCGKDDDQLRLLLMTFYKNSILNKILNVDSYIRMWVIYN